MGRDARLAPVVWQRRAVRSVPEWVSKPSISVPPRDRPIPPWVSKRAVRSNVRADATSQSSARPSPKTRPTWDPACCVAHPGVPTRPVKVQKSGLKVVGKQRAKSAALRVKHALFWQNVVQSLGQDSALAGRTGQHIRAPFACLAPSTLARHMSGWNKWVGHCAEVGARPGAGDPLVLADFCALLSPEDPECVGGVCSGAAAVKSCLNALRFVARRAAAHGIARAVADPSVAGYEKLCAPTSERKEAAPLCLTAVAALEELFERKNVPCGYLLLAGFMLACIWGSLRFSDGACTSPASLSVQGWVLRGSAWRTKVCRRGTPFGVIGIGLFGEFPSWGWVHKWLCTLNQWAGSVPTPERGAIDFLLPHFSKDGNTVAADPCSYSVAVLRLRCLLESLGVPNAGSYTAHSAKATVLSWGRQLDLADPDLAKQGHHKVALGHCAGLYGRDDVFQALKVQAQVLTSLRKGWTPMSAQRRGAEQPLQEPVLERMLAPVHKDEFAAGFRSLFQPALPLEARQVLLHQPVNPDFGGVQGATGTVRGSLSALAGSVGLSACSSGEIRAAGHPSTLLQTTPVVDHEADTESEEGDSNSDGIILEDPVSIPSPSEVRISNLGPAGICCAFNARAGVCLRREGWHRRHTAKTVGRRQRFGYEEVGQNQSRESSRSCNGISCMFSNCAGR